MGIAEAIGTTGTGVLHQSDFTDIDGEFAIVRAITNHRVGRSVSHSSNHPWLRVPPCDPRHRDRLPTAHRDWPDGRADRCARLRVHPQSVPRQPGIPRSAGLPTAERTVALHDLTSSDCSQAGGKDMQAVGGRLWRSSTSCSPCQSPNYEPNPANSMAAIAAREARCRRGAADALENDGTAMLWVPFSNFARATDGTHELPRIRTPSRRSPTVARRRHHLRRFVPDDAAAALGRDRDGARLDLEFLIQRQARDTACPSDSATGVLAPSWPLISTSSTSTDQGINPSCSMTCCWSPGRAACRWLPSHDRRWRRDLHRG